MMSDAKPPRLVSSASVLAILEAAGRSAPINSETIGALQDWLSGAIERAVRRANERPLNQKEIARLKDAYDNLRDLTAPLRGRQPPPPPINELAWQAWFTDQNSNRKRGRPDKCDWMLIADLLAIYEVTSGQKASAKVPDYEPFEEPTMDYLTAALEAMRADTPMNVKIRLHIPSRDAVRLQLPKIRPRDIEWAKISISSWLRPI
jgi:hypothetical protein